MSSALNLIIARGFGDMVRDTTLSYQRGKEMRREADNDQRQADQLASARDFNLQSAQQNQAAVLRGQARETDLMGERDALVAEIQAINEEGLRYMQSGQPPPADFLARAAAVQSRIPTLTARAAPVSSLSDVLAPQPKAAESTLGKLRADLAAGRISQADYDAAFRKATNVTPPASLTVNMGGESPVGKIIADRNAGLITPQVAEELIRRATADPGEQARLAKADEEAAKKRTAWDTFKVAMLGSRQDLSGAAAGPITGLIPPITANQQIAEGGVLAALPILKDLVRNAGEGTFTEGDQKLLTDMWPSRTTLPAAREARFRRIASIIGSRLGVPPEEVLSVFQDADRTPPAALQPPTGPPPVFQIGGATVEILQ